MSCCNWQIRLSLGDQWGLEDPELSRWPPLFLSSEAVGSAFTDCLLSADYMLTISRATKDKRPKFKGTGECWLTLINWSMVLGKKGKKSHYLKAGQNTYRRNQSFREMLAIYILEINDYQITIYFIWIREENRSPTLKAGDCKYYKWEDTGLRRAKGLWGAQSSLCL